MCVFCVCRHVVSVNFSVAASVQLCLVFGVFLIFPSLGSTNFFQDFLKIEWYVLIVVLLYFYKCMWSDMKNFFGLDTSFQVSYGCSGVEIMFCLQVTSLLLRVRIAETL
jgi:hypothetical protein